MDIQKIIEKVLKKIGNILVNIDYGKIFDSFYFQAFIYLIFILVTICYYDAISRKIKKNKYIKIFINIKLFNKIKKNKKLIVGIRQLKEVLDTTANKVFLLWSIFPIAYIIIRKIFLDEKTSEFIGISLEFYLGIIFNAVIFTFAANQVNRNANKNINEHSIWSLYNLSESALCKFEKIFMYDFLVVNEYIDITDNNTSNEHRAVDKGKAKEYLKKKINEKRLTIVTKTLILETTNKLLKDIQAWDAAYSSNVEEEYILLLRECKKILELDYFTKKIYGCREDIISEHISELILSLNLNKKAWFKYYNDTADKFIEIIENNYVEDVKKEIKDIIKNDIYRKENSSTVRERRIKCGYLCDEDYINDSNKNRELFCNKEKTIIRNFYRFIENSNCEKCEKYINRLIKK